MAMVATMNAGPLVRRVISPARNPTAVAASPAAGRDRNGEIPQWASISPALYPPMAKNTPWPSEMYPAKPPMMFQLDDIAIHISISIPICIT